MTKTDIFNIVVKIFGLYYFVRFVQHLMEFLFLVIASNTFDYGLEYWFVNSGILITIVVELVFAYVATFKTELITNRITKKNGGTIDFALNKVDLLEVALAAIGILTIVFSIPEILYQVVDSVYFHDHKKSEFWTRPNRNEMLRAIFQLTVGIFVLFNSRNFVKMIGKRGEKDDKHDEN